MNLMKLSILSLIILVASCHKDDPILDPPVVLKPIYEKVWKTRIYDAPLENVGPQNGYYYKDIYIVCGDGYSHPDPTIYAFDTKTGERKWSLKQSGRYNEPTWNMVGKDNVLILSDAKGIAAYDLDTKSLLWEDIHNDKNELGKVGQLPIYNGFVYKGISIGSFYGSGKMVRYNIKTGQKEELVNVPLEGIWSPHLSCPAFWVDNNQDTIMMFINGKSNVDKSPQESPTDLWAVNLRTNKIMWKIENVVNIGTCLGSSPVVYNDDLIFGGDWSIYSVDIPTGKVKWRTQFPDLGNFGSFSATGILLVGDKVYGNPDVFDIFCLNAENGSVIWHNKKDAPNCSPNMLYNDGMIICSSWGFGSVVILDALTGKLIHREQSPNIYNVDVLYDKATDMYLTQDFAHAEGFKINKPK